MVGVSVVGGGVNKRISTLLHYTHQPYHPTTRFQHQMTKEELKLGGNRDEGKGWL